MFHGIGLAGSPSKTEAGTKRRNISTPQPYANSTNPANSHPTKALRGYPSDIMTAHGSRATTATTPSEQGWPSETIKRQLAHADRNQVRAAYQRSELLPERCKMM